MRILLLSILLFPITVFSQILHQLSPEEISLLNISSITSSQVGFSVKFNFNGAGFTSGAVAIYGLPYSETESDTTFTSSGKVDSVWTNSLGRLILNKYHFTDTLVDSIRIERLKSIDFYHGENFIRTAEFSYEYELEPIKQKYSQLIGTWTLCHKFPSDFASYNTNADSLFFKRGDETCNFKKNKYSNSHVLKFFNNDSLIYIPRLKGKERKVGVEYFKPCSMWTYDPNGFSIGYINGTAAVFGEIRFVDLNSFWLIFDNYDE